MKCAKTDQSGFKKSINMKSIKWSGPGIFTDEFKADVNRPGIVMLSQRPYQP